MPETTETTQTHKVRWFARFPGTDEDWTPRNQHMSKAHSNFGWDAKCSCGMQTTTGGAVASHIEDLIWAHRNYSIDSGWRQS